MTTNKSHHRKLLRCLWIAALSTLLFTTGTASAHDADKPRARITHVVVVWLKNHGNEAERAKLINASRSFKSIPGVTDITVGSMIPSRRPQADSSFDVAIVMGFKDQKSLDDYTKNPIHLRAVKEALAPLASKYIIYDFVNE